MLIRNLNRAPLPQRTDGNVNQKDAYSLPETSPICNDS